MHFIKFDQLVACFKIIKPILRNNLIYNETQLIIEMLQNNLLQIYD